MATYYIDYASGSDAANGTSKATAWKNHPYMTGWGGSYSHNAADIFIFKGGVTWPAACWPMTITGSGSSGAGTDKYKTDTTWFIGGAWSRPIWDWQYTLTNQSMVNLANASYLYFDSIEICHHNSSLTFGIGLVGNNTGGANSTFYNCYFHGWKTNQATDDAHGGVIMSTSNPPSTFTLDTCIIENSEMTGTGNQNGVAVRCVAKLLNCTIHDVSSAILYTNDANGGEWYNVGYPSGNVGFDVTYHTNLCYLDNFNMGGVSPIYCRNVKIHDIGTAATPIYANPHGPNEIRIYNNLYYGQPLTSQGAVQAEPYGGTGSQGDIYVYNNTFVYTGSSAIPAVHVVSRSGNPKINILAVFNNDIIGSNISLCDATGTTVSTYTNGTNSIQTIAAAATEGRTLGNLYAPTGPTGATYNLGTDFSSMFTTDILGVSRPQAGAWDIGAYEYAPPASTAARGLGFILNPH